MTPNVRVYALSGRKLPFLIDVGFHVRAIAVADELEGSMALSIAILTSPLNAIEENRILRTRFRRTRRVLDEEDRGVASPVGRSARSCAYFIPWRTLTRTWSMASMRTNPRRGYSMSRMTYTVKATMPAKPTWCTQSYAFSPAVWYPARSAEASARPISMA